MRQALEMALEALEDRASLMKWQKARDAVKEALARPELKDEKGRPMTYWGGMAQTEALRLALEHGSFPQGSGVIHAIKEALAQPEQEPLCTAAMFDGAFLIKSGLSPHTKLYTTPPQRTWVGLTDDEIEKVWDSGVRAFPLLARELEAKLKEKNT